MITFKKVVKFKGHDGQPLAQGMLYWNEKKVGFVSQDNWGGEDIIPEACYSNKAISTFLEKGFDSREEDIEVNKFYKNIADLKNSMTVTEKIESEVIDLLLDHINEKQMKKDCKKYTIFNLKNDPNTYKLNVEYNNIVKVQIKQRYKDNLKEIINERYCKK